MFFFSILVQSQKLQMRLGQNVPRMMSVTQVQQGLHSGTVGLSQTPRLNVPQQTSVPPPPPPPPYPGPPPPYPGSTTPQQQVFLINFLSMVLNVVTKRLFFLLIA